MVKSILTKISLILILTASLFAQNGFDVTYNGTTDNGDGTYTWSYTIENVSQQGLSHWILSLCEGEDFISASPSPTSLVEGTDNSTGVSIYGVKWDLEPSLERGESQNFTVTLDKDYEAADVLYSLKYSTNHVEDFITGPSCEINEVCTGEIGDYVFVDMTGDCNGGQEGSTPIVGAEVQLFDGTNTYTATTNESGKYLFNGLCAGTYTVTIVSVPNQYSEYTLSTDGSFNVTLQNDDTKFYDADFGYCPPPPSGACVELTKEGPATAEPGDVITYTFTVHNCGNVRLGGGVNIYDEMLNPNGDHFIQYVALDPDESISFTKEYQIPADYCGDLTNHAWAEGHPVDGSPTVTDEAEWTTVVECVTDCLGEIGNYVFVDNSGDCTGDQDGSTPIEGAVVELNDGSQTFTATTDEYGYYLFNQLCPGDYTITIISVPAQYSEYTLSTSSSFNVTLENFDSKYYDADFGYCPPATECEGKIGNKVWQDDNCDGIQDAEENGIAGVTVYLKDNSGNILDTKITNENGIYRFKNLCAGTYLVYVDETTLPSDDFTATAVDQGDDSKDSDPNGIQVVLGENEINMTFDFGYCPPSEEPEVDIKVEKSASVSNVEDGSTFTYSITVTNIGTADATDVHVTDVLPEGVVFVSHSGGSYNSSTGDWNVGALASGESKVLNITVQVDVDIAYTATFDLGPASDYNLFVKNDVTQPSSDTEGRVAVGRNASFANYSVGDKLPANSGDVLVVGNNLEYTSGAVYNGNVVYGNNTNLVGYTAVSITGGTLRQDLPIDFSTAFADLRALSTTLFNYTTNGTTTFEWGGLKLTGTDPYLNVFRVDGADLTAATNLSIVVPNGSVVLVNVSGDDISWSGGLTVTGTSIGNVLYNFKQAKNITIQGIDVRGSILAPRAHVNFVTGVQNGQMICKSLEGMGQFNNTQFIGNIPSQTEIINVAELSGGVLNYDINPNNDSDGVTVVVGDGTGNGGGGTGGGSGDGDDWEYVGSFLEGQIVWSLAYTDDGCLLVGTWGGAIYKSNPEGTEFTRINEGMTVGFIWSLLVKDGYFFAGTEQGVFKYDGTSWTLVGLAGLDVRSLVTVDGKIYAGVWGGGLYVSSDNGATWTQFSSSVLSYSAVQDITVQVDLNFNVELFVATLGNGVCFSPDGGTNWTKLNVGYEFIWSIASTSTGTLFAGTYGDGLYTSNDNGGSWTKVFGVSASYVYDITVDPNDNVYISTLLGGIYTSTDGGSSFNNVGMGGFGTSSVLAVSNSESSSVYVGTSDGSIYRKGDGSGGVTAVGDDEEAPKEFKLDQNYPNPFNPTTTIQFAIPKAGDYKVVVYNILGEQVAELLNTQLQAGVHKVEFGANNLASGIYIYQLIGNEVNFTKKMILMK